MDPPDAPFFNIFWNYTMNIFFFLKKRGLFDTKPKHLQAFMFAKVQQFLLTWLGSVSSLGLSSDTRLSGHCFFFFVVVFLWGSAAVQLRSARIILVYPYQPCARPARARCTWLVRENLTQVAKEKEKRVLWVPALTLGWLWAPWDSEVEPLTSHSRGSAFGVISLFSTEVVCDQSSWFVFVINWKGGGKCDGVRRAMAAGHVFQ